MLSTDANRIREIVSERERRSLEAIRIYRPLDYQEPIFTRDATEKVVIGGNRSAKTLSCSVKFAAEMLRIPVRAQDGRALPLHCPKEHSLMGWVIGKHDNHIGTTIYDTLFRPGLFKAIRDENTGAWRTYRPWADGSRKHESVEAEPLIPARFIKHSAWKDKKNHVYSEVELYNGNIIRFYSSLAEAKQGDAIDLLWIDEDIQYEEHVAEWQARLSDRAGRLIWSAMPHSENAALTDMCERAEDQEDRERPDTIMIRLTFSANPFISADEKRKRLDAWGENEVRARDRGEFTFDSKLVYPQFNRMVHLSPPESDDEHWDEIDRVMASGEKPTDWCRYLSIDPGFTHTAVEFAAIPPPDKFGDYLVMEDELYLQRRDLSDVAKLIVEKVQSLVYELFIIDGRAARQTPMHGGPTIYEMWRNKFEELGLRCRSTGHDFVYGNDNVDSRISMVQEYLRINPDTGKPKLRLHRYRTTGGLQHEFLRYKHQVVRGIVQEGVLKRHDHAMDALGYIICRQPAYIAPSHNVRTAPPIIRAYRRILSKRSKQSDGSYYFGPASAAP